MAEILGTIRAPEAPERLRSDLRDVGVEPGRAVREKVMQVKETFEEKVRNNPLKSIAIAVGVGALIGYLLRRK